MNIYSIIAYAGSFCCIILGIFALSKNFRKSLNRIFFLMSISLAGFMLFANLCNDAADKDQLVFYYKISSVFFSFYFAINLHFNINLTKNKLKSWQCAALYLPAPVLIIATFFDHSLFSDFIRNQGHWDFVPAYNSFGFYFYNAYFVSYTITSIILVEIFRRKSSSNKEKRQALIINTGYIIAMILAHPIAITLPLFGIYNLSAIIPNIFIFYLAAIYYSVFRLKFMNLTTAVMADEIIEHISDMIIILDYNYKIIMINNKCSEILNLTPESIKGRSIYKVIMQKNDIIDKFRELLKPEKKSLNCRLNYVKDNEIIFTDAYISKVNDKFNDITGFLIISKENKGRKQFRDTYKITDREFEIIDLILSGLSNKEVGEKLGISKRTVETHILNAYTKFGIRYRMDLFNLADEYNLNPKK